MLQTMQRLLHTRPIVIFSVIIFIKSVLTWMVLLEGGLSVLTVFKEVAFSLSVFCLIEYFAGKRKLLYYWIANIVMTSILFAVIMYYKYYGVIPTYHALAQVNQVGAVRNSVFTLIHPYFLLIFLDIIIISFFVFGRKKKKEKLFHQYNQRYSRKIVLSVFSLSLAICLFNVLPHRASMNEIVKAEQMGIFNYEAYTILSSEDKELVEPKQITQDKIRDIKQITVPDQPEKYASAAGKNLIMIQMESFQNFLVNLRVDGQEITPVFNELVNNGHYFNNFYQQVGQGNTSDAEFVVNTSLYIPSRGAASQIYGEKELPSLPKLLKQAGYYTTTFHTNVVDFWNRGELYTALGFDRYYDQQFFGDDNIIFFGAPDEVLYDKTADELKRLNEEQAPFYAHVIAMTAHHPYTIPEELTLIDLPNRFNDTMVGSYLKSQYYADYALGSFIEDLKAQGVWEDSLIVLYGDHLGLPMYSLTREEKDLMSEIYGREYNYTDMINIPLIIIDPNDASTAVHEQLGGQIDILPTLANLLGVSLDNQIHFGQDLMNQPYNILPQRYYLPTGSFLSSQELFLSGSGYEDGTHYSLAGNGVSEERSATEDEFERALELLNLSDSYANQLPSWKKQANKK
ncbi:LTA synthase family protein [Paenibacillus yanchengensis]|uniref:LTA synthase family protein n=1 Tax=Paenibacillus yanchengensis TaxID=2035833 RepID=A0ABW4YP99_9BACL